MQKSPSLFFDILIEEDEEKRDEKIRRASIELHTNGVGEPGRRQHNRANAWPSAAAGATGAPQEQQQQQLPNGAGPVLQQQQQQQTQQLQQQQQQQPQQQQQQPQRVKLSPQEVLQELLGDLYVDPSRLTMGEQLGQGGFADVHFACLADPLVPAFSEEVAVKRLRPDVLKSPDDLREFLTEANLLRKLQHRNIVRLRGVGANDLTDLVSMRESMYVVQEFMAGGDLKELVMGAMTCPFDPPYTKPHAFAWAMHIAEAMHYLHSVCRPMIIHRDLKLDNVLLTGGCMNERVAKLADFGLHKRVRKMTSSGALVAWSQELTYHGLDFEPSFYGGRAYLGNRSAFSANGSVRGGSVHGSQHGGSMHGSQHSGSMQGDGSAHGGGGSGHGGGGSGHGGGSWHKGAAGAAALGATNGTTSNGAAPSAMAPDDSASSNVGLGPNSRSDSGSLVASGAPLQGAGPRSKMRRAPSFRTVCEASVQEDSAPLPSVAPSDSAASLPAGSAAGQGPDSGNKGRQQQEQQEQQVVLGALRAKSQGRLGKQDFVAQLLSVPSAKSHVWQGGVEDGGDKEVARTFAAVQALEGSVRAGTAYHQDTQQQQQQQQQDGQQPPPPPHQQQQQQPPLPLPLPVAPSSPGPSSPSQRLKLRRQRSELCPQLVQALSGGLGPGATNSAKFIEATQKVGSVMYMAPEVLIGHQYNEKIDVFSFGIILYELLSGVVIASRVAMAGQHEELLDYARSVANGHREDIPHHWPASVRHLIAACWAQDPRARPSFKEVLKQLYAMRQSGVDVAMEGMRPRGNYNPVMDCGCSLM